MTSATIQIAVRERFDALIRDGQSVLTIYDNGPDPEPTTPLWCRFTIETDRPEPVSTAPVRWRIRGRGIAHLHVAAQQGDADLLTLFAAIEAAFTAVSLASPMVQFQRPSLAGPPQLYGGWFRRTSRIEFYADEIGLGD